MNITQTWIRYVGALGLVASLAAYAEAESEEPAPAGAHAQAQEAASVTEAPPPGPAAQPARPKRNLSQDVKNNYCGDAVMKNATALLYAAGNEAFAAPQADEKRRQFIESNFNSALQLKITKYRNKRPRYFEVQWPFPGLEKKFKVMRYTLDSPTGNFTGQIEDVVKVEPIDPATGAPVVSTDPHLPKNTFEICRYNAYRCLHPSGCRWQLGKPSSEAERVKGIAAVEAFTKKPESAAQAK